MNFFFLLLLIFFWGIAAYSIYAAYRGYEYTSARVGVGNETKDLEDVVISFVFSIVGATFGAALKLLFGRLGSYGIFMAQAAICLVLGAVMLWLGIVFA